MIIIMITITATRRGGRGGLRLRPTTAGLRVTSLGPSARAAARPLGQSPWHGHGDRQAPSLSLAAAAKRPSQLLIRQPWQGSC